MGWLVPTLDNDGGIAARFGHVLFYIGSGIAGLFAAGGVWAAYADWDNPASMFVCVAFAAFFYLLGRVLCYIFSGD